MWKLGGTSMDEPVGYDVIIDRILHEVPYSSNVSQARGASGHCRRQQSLLVVVRRQVVRLIARHQARCGQPEDDRVAEPRIASPASITMRVYEILQYPLD